MEKIIKIGDRDIPVRSTAAALIRYKANFGRDALGDLFKLSENLPKDEAQIEIGENLDFDIFIRFLWVFAKSADKTIPPLEDWLDGFDILPIDFITEVLPQTVDLLASTVKSEIQAKKK